MTYRMYKMAATTNTSEPRKSCALKYKREAVDFVEMHSNEKAAQKLAT